DRVLILLRDRLLEFNAAANKTTTLERVEESSIGEFIHMSEGRDGKIWISAEKGVAEVRRTKAGETSIDWREYVFPKESGLQDLAFPIEGENGEVFATAFSVQDGRRVLVRFDGEIWRVYWRAENEDVLMGWRGAEDDVWLLKSQFLLNPFSLIHSSSVSPSLSRIQNGQEQPIELTPRIGIFENHVDIGHPTPPGDASYDSAAEVYDVTGGGVRHSDDLHFVYLEVSGDFSLAARISAEDLGGSAEDWATAGIAVRDSLKSGIRVAGVNGCSAWVTINEEAIVNWDYADGRFHLSPLLPSDTHDGRLEMVRQGNSISVYYYSRESRQRTLLDSQFLDLPEMVYVGFFASSWRAGAYTVGHFSDVELKADILGNIPGVAAEANGVFWLTNGGLARHAPPTWRTPPAVAEIDGKGSSITEDKGGRLWFAAMNALVCLESGEWKIHQLPGKRRAAGEAPHLCPLPDGRIAVLASDACLYTLDPGSQDKEFISLAHPSGRGIRSIAPRRNGGCWVVTSDGSPQGIRIEMFDGERFKTIPGEHEDIRLGSSFHDFLEDTNGDLWLAGTKGIGVRKAGEYQEFDSADELTSGPFFCLAEMDGGRIWAGGENKIVEFDGEVRRIVATGLDGVHQIMRRGDGSLWVASRIGVYRYVEGLWTPNTEKDGLPAARSYRLFEDSQGRFWAGTSSGLSRYHPEVDSEPPQTYVPPEKNLTETSPEGEVRFVYSGMDKWNYTKETRLLFSHRMDGGEWSPFTSDTTASATGLSPGSHRFEVRAIDRNWNIDPIPAVFEFAVPTHWYRQPLFLISLLSGSITLLLLLGLHIYHYFRLETLVSARTAQLRRTERHLLEISEREQQRIGRDLHDDVVQDLTAIAMSGDLLATEMEEQSPGTAKDLRNVIRLIDDTSAKTRRLARGLFPVNLDELGLVASLQEMAAAVQRLHGIRCRFENNAPIPLKSGDIQLNLYRIVQEAVNNAVKHADAKNLTIRLLRLDLAIKVDVEDDGVGFSVEPGDGEGMGLHIMRYRANLIGAELRVNSKPGEGTRISCRLPIDALDV
ncbi:MAG: two-component regulator propeller domain-containing protein, partial [bacterium]